MQSANDSLPKTFKLTNGTKLSLNDVHLFSYGRSEETDCTHTTSDIINHPREVWCRYTLNDIEP